MGWQINLVENTLVVPEAAIPDLREIAAGIDCDWGYDEDADITDEDGHFIFSDDAMEHMDYMWNEELQVVLTKHKANGEVIFNSFQGDNRGQAWGYRFVNGKLTELSGNAKTMELKPV